MTGVRALSVLLCHAEILDSVGMQVETLSLGRWRQIESSEMPCSLVFLSGRPNLEFTPGDQVLEDQEWAPHSSTGVYKCLKTALWSPK